MYLEFIDYEYKSLLTCVNFKNLKDPNCFVQYVFLIKPYPLDINQDSKIIEEIKNVFNETDKPNKKILFFHLSYTNKKTKEDLCSQIYPNNTNFFGYKFVDDFNKDIESNLLYMGDYPNMNSSLINNYTYPKNIDNTQIISLDFLTKTI